MNEHPQQSDRTLRDTRILTLRIWSVVGCIVIAAVIFNLMGILAPVIEFLAVGSIIAFVMSPITNWLEHHGVGRGFGSLVALIVVVAVLVGVVCILSPILFGQIMEVLSRLPAQLRVAGGDLNEMISHAKTLNNTAQGVSGRQSFFAGYRSVEVCLANRCRARSRCIPAHHQHGLAAVHHLPGPGACLLDGL